MILYANDGWGMKKNICSQVILVFSHKNRQADKNIRFLRHFVSEHHSTARLEKIVKNRFRDITEQKFCFNYSVDNILLLLMGIVMSQAVANDRAIDAVNQFYQQVRSYALQQGFPNFLHPCTPSACR